MKYGYISLALMLVVFVIAMSACTNLNGSTDQKQQSADQDKETNSQVMEKTSASMGDTKTFVMTGVNFRFFMDGMENPELRVKKGDKVVIEFQSTDGFHDFVIDEFNAATDRVNTGETTSVEFIADKTGTFEYYCSVGQHRANGMFGTLVVEE